MKDGTFDINVNYRKVQENELTSRSSFVLFIRPNDETYFAVLWNLKEGKYHTDGWVGFHQGSLDAKRLDFLDYTDALDCDMQANPIRLQD